MGLEAPYVGNPPESPEPPDNWIDDEEHRSLSNILEIAESTVAELEGETPQDRPETLNALLEVAKVVARETSSMLDGKCWGDSWMEDE